MKPLRIPLMVLALCVAAEASATPAAPSDGPQALASEQRLPQAPQPAASATLVSQADLSTAVIGSTGGGLPSPSPSAATAEPAGPGEMPWTWVLLVVVLVVLFVSLRRRPDR